VFHFIECILVVLSDSLHSQELPLTVYTIIFLMTDATWIRLFFNLVLEDEGHA